MPNAHDRSDPHRRTRRDHSTETAEDYVEAIADIVQEHGNCRVVDLANRFGVSHVTVTRTISRLLEEGWVQTAPYRPIALTGKGRRLATEARRRHAIVYRFLIAVGVDERTAAIDAEGIEHHVSPQTLVRLEEFTRGASRAPRK
jgi:DtxR family manganese transport transcriptional regulator